MTDATFEPALSVSDRIALVAIGRNEGDRLKACIASARRSLRNVIYVDSGSTDGSLELARALGARVVELDLTIPFTAARARNAGLAVVLRELPKVDCIQFVDGDCEVEAGWLEAGLAFLDANPGVAVVAGRRRERYPERTIYNRLCDMSWQSPAGDAAYFGGDALIRTAVLVETGGYRADFIAGEEPELAVRIRAKGWKIHRIDAPMTLHDAAMVRFGQWWKRTERTGYAYAMGAHLHGLTPARHWVRETARALIWGLGLPLGILLLIATLGPPALVLLLVYPLQVLRIWHATSPHVSGRLSFAVFTVAGKLPEAIGVLHFARDLATGQRRRLIEYK